jgi:hypothetical protein
MNGRKLSRKELKKIRKDFDTKHGTSYRREQWIKKVQKKQKKKSKKKMGWFT